jgi:transposase
VTPPWEGKSKHLTKEFEAFALVLTREMPVRKASEILKESDQRLWRMILAHVDAAYKEADFSLVTCVGADEMSRRKGHHYVSVFFDMLAKRVLYATEGKDSETWHRFVEELEKHNGHPHAITEISMDMSPAYIRGASDTCRNAQIVFDKFHVIAHVNDAVDHVRKNEIRRGDFRLREQLKKTRWLWLKNPENLTEKQHQHFQRIDQQNLQTSKAYQMKLTLQDIYQIPHVTLAKKKLTAWCRWVRRATRRAKFQLLDSMQRCAQMIETHLDGILAHWKYQLTNSNLEALNSVFSAVKRKARGYRSTRYLIAMLYFISGKLRIPAT